MHPRVVLAGSLGGLAASITLRYPLYQFIPTLAIPDWPAASITLAWMGLALTALVFLIAGAIGGRLSELEGRSGGAAGGAIAGLISALLGYAAWGGSAAGVYGSRAILSHGSQPAIDNPQFLSWLSEAVLQTFHWSYLGYWAAAFLGVTLGALGGWLVKGQGRRPIYPTLLSGLAVAGALTTSLGLIVCATLFNLLPGQITQAALEAGHDLSLPAWTATVWPAATHLAWLIFFLFIGLAAIRRSPSGAVTLRSSSRTTALILFGLPILLAVLLYFLARETLLQPIVWVGILISIGIGGGILRLGWSRKNIITDALVSPSDPASLLGWFSLTTAYIIGLIAYVGSLVPLNTVSLIIPLIPVLSPEVADSSTVQSITNLVQVNYAMHLNTFRYMLWIPLVVGAVGYAGGWAFKRYRQPKAAQ